MASPIHTNCVFTGRLVCRCLCGTSVQLQDGGGAASGAASAGEYMQRARLAWRLLHHPGGHLTRNEPVVVMLPKLVRQGPPAGSQLPQSAPAPTYTAAAALAARVQQAEAAARNATLRAATLAAASGLAYRLPEGVPLDLSAIFKADYCELERQVKAVHKAQEARQAIAAAAASAAVAAQQAGAATVPMAMPFAAPVGIGRMPAIVPLATLMGGGPPPADTPEPPAALGAGVSDRLPTGGRPVRRTRSLEPSVAADAFLPLAHSLPMPMPSGGGGGGRGQRRSPAGSRPRPKSAAAAAPAPPGNCRAGRQGPGKGLRAGKPGARQQHDQQQQAGLTPGLTQQEPSSGGRPAPNLTPFGEGYVARGPSAATPPKAWLLRVRDFKPSLQGRLVQTYWSDGGRWWPAVVLSVSIADRSCSLYYETGDEEQVAFTQLIQAGEVAWLMGLQHQAAVAARSGSADGSSRRWQQQSGMQSPSLQSNRSSDQQQQQPQGMGEGQRAAPPTGRPKRQRSTAGAMSPHSPPSLPALGAGAAGPVPSGGGGTSSGARELSACSSGQLIAGMPSMGANGSAAMQQSADLLTWRAASSDGGGLSLAPSLDASLPVQHPTPSSRMDKQLLLLPPAPLGAGLEASLPPASSGDGEQQLAPDSSGGAVLPSLPPPPTDIQPSQSHLLAHQQAAAAPQQAEAGTQAQPLLHVELPPPLGAGLASMPAGCQLARVQDLLGLEEQAVGRRLFVCSLTSGGWQAALVRQCSARHELIQVQFSEREGVLLQAQEEGKTFVLCAAV